MTFQFAPAVRDQVSLLIALAGASGSGKTFSALRLAKGMAPSGKIAFIDTEARRGLHYAGQFDFLHTDMRPPFQPARFIEAIHAAENVGAEVVIIDSFSHEYDGEGGIMDWADRLAEQGTKSPGNWKEPKLAHKKMMNALLQCRASLIFCLRADEKIAIERKEIEENGRTRMKTVITPLGWVPICEKRFMYEMTASFTLTPDRPGLPQFHLPHKLQEQHRAMFSDKQPIGEESGRALAEWARGGASGRVRDYAAELAEAAQRGSEALRATWGAVPKEQRAALKPALDGKYKAAAQKADAAADDYDTGSAAGFSSGDAAGSEAGEEDVSAGGVASPVKDDLAPASQPSEPSASDGMTDALEWGQKAKAKGWKETSMPRCYEGLPLEQAWLQGLRGTP